MNCILWDCEKGGAFGHILIAYPDSSKSHPFSMEEELQYLWRRFNESQNNGKITQLSFADYLYEVGRFGNSKFEAERQAAIAKIRVEGYSPEGQPRKEANADTVNVEILDNTKLTNSLGGEVPSRLAST